MMIAREGDAQYRDRGRDAPGGRFAGSEEQRFDRLHLRDRERPNLEASRADRDRLRPHPHHEASAKDQVITVPVASARSTRSSNSGTTKSSSLVCRLSLLEVQALSFSETAWPWKVV